MKRYNKTILLKRLISPSLFTLIASFCSFTLMADIKYGTDSFVEGSTDTRDLVLAPLECASSPIISGTSISGSVLYQSYYQSKHQQSKKFQSKHRLNGSNSQEKDGALDNVTWVGELSALMLDASGRARRDDGNKILDSAETDPIIDTCFDGESQSVRVKFSRIEYDRPSHDEFENCSELIYSKSLEDIGYLWRAGDWLNKLANREVAQQRSAYRSSDSARYIKTNIAQQELDFIPENFPQARVGLLNSANTEDAAKVINFIRGADQKGMRSRQLNGKIFRLGDIIHSKPVAVGSPAENIHLLYNDDSYADFVHQYKNRRTMIYVGSNDGMLHAFNGGKGNDVVNRKSSTQQWALGQETWAFVPFNLLPHLQYLTRKSYGQMASDHLKFVDQTPYVFDAQIFGSEGVHGQADPNTHPQGWGTIMVVGFGLGGARAEVYLDPSHPNSTAIQTVRPAYLIFDITDPEQPPKFLVEFSHEQLGATLSSPTALTVKNSTGTLNWYLAMGSGPSDSEQSAHLFMLNLKTMKLEPSFAKSGVMNLGEAASSVGDLLAVDVDMDASTDALYFGTSSRHKAYSKKVNWGGKFYRLRINSNKAAGHPLWKVEVMFNASAPIIKQPLFSIDQKSNRWIHFGTGQLLSQEDLTNNSRGMLYGLKEPRNTQGVFEMDNYESVLKPLSNAQLIDVSRATVDINTGQLSGSVSVSPALSEDTFAALDERLQQFKETRLYRAGWRKQLARSERVVDSGAIVGGVLSQATFLAHSKSTVVNLSRYMPSRHRPPTNQNCGLKGRSFLYTLRHTTGTGWPQSDLASSSLTASTLTKVLAGSRENSTPLIHFDEQIQPRKVSLIQVKPNGIIDTEVKASDSLNSQEISWREL